MARPSRSRSSSRRGGTEQPDTKRGTGIPPAASRPPAAPPGLGDTPRRRVRGRRVGEGPGPPAGDGQGTPGRMGCGGSPRRGRGGAEARTVSAAPGAPRWPPRGPGAGEGRRGSPVFPRGGGPRGLTPSGLTGSLLFLRRGGRVPPPPGVPIGRVLGTPAPAAQPRAGRPRDGRRGGASGRGGGLGPRRLGPPPPPLASPFPHPGTRSPSPTPTPFRLPLRPPLFPTSPNSAPGPPVPRDPRKAAEKTARGRPAGRRDLPCPLRPGAPRPRPAGCSPPCPEGSPGGRGRGCSLRLRPFSHCVPQLRPEINKQRPICKSRDGPEDFGKRVEGGGRPGAPRAKALLTAPEFLLYTGCMVFVFLFCFPPPAGAVCGVGWGVRYVG